MDCTSSTVEIQTILTRIKDGDINLQPDFQRGEVWSINKKKKLIDSILRDWKIPPIHVVEGENGIDEVLDGQQRLNSIKCFFNNEFPVDGSIQPIDPEIQELDYLRYKDLPVEYKRKFNKYVLTIVRLTKYKADEPAELFYRLNQPATLTAAEQRNAYIGTTRNQIKELVKIFEKAGANKDTIGFSNSRLAYDEIISKFVYLIEEGSLKKKITANDISMRYRNDQNFKKETILTAETVVSKFMAIIKQNEKNEYNPKFSKATLLSWFIFIKKHKELSDDLLLNEIYLFESLRDYFKGKHSKAVLNITKDIKDDLITKYGYFEAMINMFNQRASMGSTDALAVIYRDIIINIFNSMIYEKKSSLLCTVNNNYENDKNFGVVIDLINKTYFWGETF
ncbi:MAG: DUF262 domain-containing protein [Lachnospiraceae bacterium]|nr:DUF262 domain-containing protein [Lachnospiraceae bacterium]